MGLQQWLIELGCLHDRQRSFVKADTGVPAEAGAARQLNHLGWRTFNGKPFRAARVLSLRRDHQLKDHGTRLRERGLLTADEAASAYGVCRETIMAWGRAGVLPTSRMNDHGMVVFLRPYGHAPQKYAHKYPKTC